MNVHVLDEWDVYQIAYLAAHGWERATACDWWTKKGVTRRVLNDDGEYVDTPVFSRDDAYWEEHSRLDGGVDKTTV